LILGANNDLGEQVGHHLFRYAETHLHITKTHITTNEMIPYLKVTHIAQSIWVACNVKASHGVGVERVRFGARKPQEA
jgi:hypothetical protein